MQRLKPINKFYRRYEVDLWGRVSAQRVNKTVRFLQKVQKEKVGDLYFKGFNRKKVIVDHKSRDRKIKQSVIDKEKKKNKSKDPSRFKSKRGKKRKIKKEKFKQKEKKLKIKYEVKKRQRQNFLFRIDYANPHRKRAKTSLSRELFLVKTKLLHFYANIKSHQLKLYANAKTFKIKFKLIRGLGDQNIAKYRNKNIFKKLLALDAFFSLIEHRLDIMLFRSNFAETIKHARQLINHRHIYVNGYFVSHCGHILKNFDVVSLKNKKKYIIFKNLKKNLKKKRIAFYPPKYIYTDYSLMISMLIFNPKINQVPFPFKIDLGKWLGLAKHTL
jgi:ribosomal protein S4